jgi:plasmid stabilization system protein ParE
MAPRPQPICCLAPTRNTVVYTIGAAGDVTILRIVHGAQRWPEQLD